VPSATIDLPSKSQKKSPPDRMRMRISIILTITESASCLIDRDPQADRTGIANSRAATLASCSGSRRATSRAKRTLVELSGGEPIALLGFENVVQEVRAVQILNGHR
jgi:hypothetical protein